MRLTITFALSLILAALSGCGGGLRDAAPQGVSAPNAAPQEQAAGAAAGGDVAIKTVSLQQTEDSTPQQQSGQPAAVERKIIRNATLTLEADDPSKAVQRVASVAESRGGFVVTSESRQQGGSRGSKGYEVFTVEMRVPAAQFDAALAEIRAAAGGVTSERITGKDVTEEYIDLEARLRTQRALETQLMEIMKGAEEVADAIAVQRELTNVRTEIERLEGRRRFLENQASLSTISVTVQPTKTLVSTSGFFNSLGRAFGEGVDIAATVTLFLISFLLAILPVVVFFGLVYLLVRYAVRRARRARPAPPPQPPAQEYQQPPPPVA
ncbi:MAG TPA: DUF4349 domain-containing protein [Pyrinomonadaceae bacterium]|jgi:hypothetical protein